MKSPSAFLLPLIFGSVFLSGCGSTNQTVGSVQPSVQIHDEGVAPWIRNVEGNVFVKRGTSLFHAQDHVAIHTNDVVITSPTSSADIVWPSYGHTALGNGTSLTILETTDTEKTFSEKLRLETGRTWTRLQRLLGSESFFGIQASNVSSVVRGTSFGVNVTYVGVNVQVTESHVGVSHLADATSLSFSTTGSEVLVPSGQETVVPFDSRDIPQPKLMDTRETKDPFIVQANKILPDDILNATSSIELSEKNPSSQTIAAIEYRGHQLPIDQILSEQAEKRCSFEHYHAKNGFVTAIDGTMMYDPGSCGFGVVSETPTTAFELK